MQTSNSVGKRYWFRYLLEPLLWLLIKGLLSFYISFSIQIIKQWESLFTLCIWQPPIVIHQLSCCWEMNNSLTLWLQNDLILFLDCTIRELSISLLFFQYWWCLFKWWPWLHSKVHIFLVNKNNVLQVFRTL